jgi:nicotinate dehydrogenase subunit A
MIGSSPALAGRAKPVQASGVSNTEFTVNGRSVRVASEGSAPLLSVLRDELALSGPKFGCGQGECGACVVLVDGQPQASCNLPIWSVQGKQVVTIEGLGTPEQPHALQAAFIEERAAQCGYCVAGIVTAAAALLQHNPDPSREQIAQALDKHLCRCGAHNRMIRAVQRAAATLRGNAS